MKINPAFPEIPTEAISRTYYSNRKKPIFEKLSDLFLVAGGSFTLFVGMDYYQTGILSLPVLVLEAGGALIISGIMFWWQFRRNADQLVGEISITLNMNSVNIQKAKSEVEFPLLETEFIENLSDHDNSKGEKVNCITICHKKVTQLQIVDGQFADFHALKTDLVAFGMIRN